MFNGKMRIWKDNNMYRGELSANTPNGPISVVVAAPDKITVGQDLEFAASFFPPKQLVGAKKARRGKMLFDMMHDPRKKDMAFRLLQSLKKDSVSGNEESKDVLYVVGQLAQRSLQLRNENKVDKVYVPYSIDPIELRANLCKLAKTDKAAAKAMKLYSLVQKGGEVRERAAKVIKSVVKKAALGDFFSKRVVYFMRKWKDVRQAEKTQIVSGFGEMGFSFEKMFKDIGKAVGPVVKTVANVVQQNPQLVSMIPYAGPMIVAGAQLLNGASNGNPQAIQKVQTVKQLAQAGVPRAINAMTHLQQAQDLRAAVKIDVAKQLGTPMPSEFYQKLDKDSLMRRLNYLEGLAASKGAIREAGIPSSYQASASYTPKPFTFA